jgi:hypothetical protein
MDYRILGQALAFSLTLGLAACGGGGGGGSTGSGGDTGGTGGSGDTGGTGGTGGDTGGTGDTGAQPADYSRLYNGIGFMPASLSAGLTADEAVEDAVAPAYLVLGALQATSDLRMNLQAFEWAVPALVRKAVDENGPLQPDQVYPVSCQFSSSEGAPAGSSGFGRGTARVHYGESYADGSVRGGEPVTFELGDCQPSGGMRAMSSAAPQQVMYIGGNYAVRLDSVALADYGPLQASNTGWMVRSNLPGYVQCDNGEQCAQMVLSNRSPDGSQPALSQLDITEVDAEQPVRLAIWSDGEAATAADIQTHVEPADQSMVFAIPALDLHLDGGSAERSGHYQVSTLDEGLALQYATRNFALSRFSMLRGGFEVAAPDGAVYTYRADPDPLYLQVDVDRDGNGTVDAQGRISEELVTQRLYMAQ